MAPVPRRSAVWYAALGPVAAVRCAGPERRAAARYVTQSLTVRAAWGVLPLQPVPAQRCLRA